MVSIPRSGFWVFKHHPHPLGSDGIPSFNPSVGILGVQAASFRPQSLSISLFQSLGRDSGCSSQAISIVAIIVSIVSIPRSGFWVFKPSSCGGSQPELPRFNPSVGILGVQASSAVRPAFVSPLFQSLGRDSGCSSKRVGGGLSGGVAVSIPRSGFWVFKLKTKGKCNATTKSFNPSVGILGVQARGVGHPSFPMTLVSIPRSGFWVFKLPWAPPPILTAICFNPSVGILGVQAGAGGGVALLALGFQSLGRDSGCSSLSHPATMSETIWFQSLGRDSGCSSGASW